MSSTRLRLDRGAFLIEVFAKVTDGFFKENYEHVNCKEVLS